MTNEYMVTQYSNQLKCEVCGISINSAEYFLNENSEFTVCSSLDCKRIISQKASTPPDIFKSYVEQIRDRREKEAAKKIHIEKVKSREAQENQRIFKSVLGGRPELSENNTHVLSISSGFSDVAPPSNKRVKRYIKHLKNIISKASEYANASQLRVDQYSIAHKSLAKVEHRFAENPVLRTMSDKLCAICKGSCCAAGKEHAFLSVFTIRRLMDANPKLTAEDVLNLYLSHIQSETIENGCINQTKTGCSLPRELRADNCNAFYCQPIKSYQQKQAGKKEIDVVLAIQRSIPYFLRYEEDQSNNIVNIALVTEKDLQYVDVSLND